MEKIKLEVKNIKNIEKNYKGGIKELTLNWFIIILQKLKNKKEKYKRLKRYNYYLIIDSENYYNIFMKDFIQFLQSFWINSRSKNKNLDIIINLYIKDNSLIIFL